jgi:hypothetical protein
MRHFYRAFARSSDGSWTCIEATTLEHPAGRIQVAEGSRFYPGTTFMGIDLVRLLDEERSRLERA